MDIVYYFNKELKYSPVKKYLEKYIPNEKDNQNKINKKERILIGIREKISFINENKGVPDGNIAKPIHGYNFFQIRAGKDKKILIRILYFCFRNKNLLVLLNAFEKPDNYDTEKERREINKHYQNTEKYLKDFKINSNNYEKYE